MQIVFNKETKIDVLLHKRSASVRHKMYVFLQTVVGSLALAYLYRNTFKFTWVEWGFTHQQRKDLIGFLTRNDLIDRYQRGFKFSDDLKRESELYPTEKMFESIIIKEDNIDTKTKIRYEGGNESRFNDNDSKFLLKYAKTLYGNVNVPIMSLNRIYSKDIGYGGRVYSAYQSMPAIIRSEFTKIDGDNVVELDYKNNHINIILSMMNPNHDTTFDLYSLFDDFCLSRSTIKRAVSVMLNATRPSAAFMNRLGKFNWSKEMTDAFIDHFYMHFRIINDMQTGYELGMHLQKFEGDVIMELLKVAHSNKEIILPVHDSIIVQDTHKRRYFDVMKHVWNDQIKNKRNDFLKRFTNVN